MVLVRAYKNVQKDQRCIECMPNGVGLLIVLATFYHMLCYAKVADRADLPPRSSRLQEPMYKLHTICGVNKYVSGPVGTVAKCYRSHVNFLATPKGTQFSAGKNPVFFLGEVSNDDEGRAGAQSFCCSVSVPIPCSRMISTLVNSSHILSFE